MVTVSGERDRTGRAGTPRPRGPITGAMQRMLDAAPPPSAPAESLAVPVVAVNPHLRRASVQCRFCGARIVLALLPGGRRMPVDLAPDPAGTVAVRVDHTFTVRARMITAERDQLEGSERLHVTHFATCGPRVADDARPEPAYRTRARHRQSEDPEEQW